MNGFLTMLKINLKLLFRNKGYLCFLIILPLLSILLLNIPREFTMNTDKDSDYQVHELENDDAYLLTSLNIRMIIKVYDCSGSDLSEYLLNQLAESGSFDVYRIAMDNCTKEEVEEMALNSSNHNTIGSCIYIPKDFDEKVMNENPDSGIFVFEGSNDERNEILTWQINRSLQSLYRYSSISKNSEAQMLKLINSAEELSLEKEAITVRTDDTLALTQLQKAQSGNIGYSLAIITMGFLFSGVFIASIVVEEKNNRVLSRIKVSDTGAIYYGSIKIILTLVTTIIQTLMTGIGIKLFVGTDFGIPLMSYLFFVFGIGLVFNSLSVIAGILTNDILTANYIAFFVWSLSAIVAGLYFSIDGAADWWDKVALCMPQRWFIKASEMLMANEPGVYLLYSMVICGYMAIILSIGLIGMKLNTKQ